MELQKIISEPVYDSISGKWKNTIKYVDEKGVQHGTTKTFSTDDPNQLPHYDQKDTHLISTGSGVLSGLKFGSRGGVFGGVLGATAGGLAGLANDGFNVVVNKVYDKFNPPYDYLLNRKKEDYENQNGCFVAETPILMGNGRKKPISEIQIGEEVMAFEGFGPLEPRRVTNILVHEECDVVEMRGIKVTAEHPFLTAEGDFKPLKAISSVEQIVNKDDVAILRGALKPVAGRHRVYNLTVEGLHTYIAGDFRVHNVKPVLLDLDGDGQIALLNQKQSTARFDYDGDGQREKMGWVGPKDGFLVIDLDGSDTINSPEELAFALSTEAADTDLQALISVYDENGDRVLDRADAKSFRKFGIWQDHNQDGKTDAGEFMSLEQAGIERLNLSYDPVVENHAGNYIFNKASFDWVDGRQGLALDVDLQAEIPSDQVRILQEKPRQISEEARADNANIARCLIYKSSEMGGLIPLIQHMLAEDPEEGRLVVQDLIAQVKAGDQDTGMQLQQKLSPILCQYA